MTGTRWATDRRRACTDRCSSSWPPERRAWHSDLLIWESIALGNLLAEMALNRENAFHVVDALAVLERMAPGRAVQDNAGPRRGGFSHRACIYFPLHSTLDVKHSQAWNEDVLRPIVHERPALAQPVAEGTLIRLHSGARSFRYYREELDRS